MTGRARELDVTVGPWARDKLQALGEYLEYFNTRLKFQPWLKATLFIDGFAGAGYSKIRSKADLQPLLMDMPDQEQSELIAGSPRVALELKTPFDYYLFIEQDALRAAELEKLISIFPSCNITVRLGDAGSVISEVISKRKSWGKYRGVVFLDPFGTHLPWSAVEKLGATKAFEVLVNFPLQMAIQRLIPREGVIDEEWRGHFDTYFGTKDWFKEVYEQADGLFGGELIKRPDYSDRLLRFYLSRLKKTFGNVSLPKLICNTKKRPLYYLIWAGPHRAGLTGAQHILSKGDHVTA